MLYAFSVWVLIVHPSLSLMVGITAAPHGHRDSRDREPQGQGWIWVTDDHNHPVSSPFIVSCPFSFSPCRTVSSAGLPGHRQHTHAAPRGVVGKGQSWGAGRLTGSLGHGKRTMVCDDFREKLNEFGDAVAASHSLLREFSQFCFMFAKKAYIFVSFQFIYYFYY